MTNNDFDILIIGAGVIGCSIARQLAKSTLSIAVLEAQNDVATGASKANSGIVHGGYDERHGTLKSRLAHRGNQMFPQLNAELHFGFRVTGSLVVAFEESEESHLHRLLENGMRNGVAGLRLVGAKELRRMEPNINPTATKALYCPHTGVCSPYEYTIALAENASVNGVQFYLNHQVCAISNRHYQHRRFLVRCNRQQRDNEPEGSVVEFSASIVINCSGLYADQISRMLAGPQSSFQIVPRKGEYLLLDKVQGELVERVLFPVPSDTRGKGILVSQTYWGNLLIGPTSRPADELITNDQVLGRIIRSAKRLVPSLDVRRTITSYSGLRAKSDGGDFIIESHPADRWLINVAGIDSPGLTSSPAVAVYVEELLQSLLTADQVGPEPPQQPRISLITARPAYQFNPIRPPIIQPKSAGFRGSLTDDSDPARYIVCRCEKITKAELIDGLHRPVAVRPSLTAIKRRTRVGMGQCQGRYCEQRVLEIMRKELGVEHVDGLEPGSSLLPHRRVEPEDRNRLAHLVGEDETDSDETLKPKL